MNPENPIPSLIDLVAQRLGVPTFATTYADLRAELVLTGTLRDTDADERRLRSLFADYLGVLWPLGPVPDQQHLVSARVTEAKLPRSAWAFLLDEREAGPGLLVEAYDDQRPLEGNPWFWSARSVIALRGTLYEDAVTVEHFRFEVLFEVLGRIAATADLLAALGLELTDPAVGYAWQGKSAQAIRAEHAPPGELVSAFRLRVRSIRKRLEAAQAAEGAVRTWRARAGLPLLSLLEAARLRARCLAAAPGLHARIVAVVGDPAQGSGCEVLPSIGDEVPSVVHSILRGESYSSRSTWRKESHQWVVRAPLLAIERALRESEDALVVTRRTEYFAAPVRKGSFAVRLFDTPRTIEGAQATG